MRGRELEEEGDRALDRGYLLIWQQILEAEAMRILGLMADSGLLVAITAVALLAACSHALGQRPDAATWGLVLSGSLGVYLVDRLRDAHRDLRAHPGRSRAFLQHRRAVATIAAVLVGVAATLAWHQPMAVRLLLMAVFALSIAHAALKQLPWLKPVYIGLSWWSVTMGIPILLHWREHDVWPQLSTVLPVGLAIAANVLACDAADRDAEALRLSPERLWWVARVVAAAGVASGVLAGALSAKLALIPLAVLLSLLPQRPTVLWTTVAVDGALLLGALAVLVWV